MDPYEITYDPKHFITITDPNGTKYDAYHLGRDYFMVLPNASLPTRCFVHGWDRQYITNLPELYFTYGEDFVLVPI